MEEYATEQIHAQSNKMSIIGESIEKIDIFSLESGIMYSVCKLNIFIRNRKVK